MEMQIVSEQSEQGADSRAQGLREGFLEEVAFLSCLPNGLIYLQATDFFPCPCCHTDLPSNPAYHVIALRPWGSNLTSRLSFP